MFDIQPYLIRGTPTVYPCKINNWNEITITIYKFKRFHTVPSHLIPIGFRLDRVPEDSYLLSDNIRVMKDRMDIYSALVPESCFSVYCPKKIPGESVEIGLSLLYVSKSSYRNVKENFKSNRYHSYENDFFQQIKPWSANKE